MLCPLFIRRSSKRANYKPSPSSFNKSSVWPHCVPSAYLAKGPFEVISTKAHWIQLRLISSVMRVRRAVKWQRGRGKVMNTCHSGWMLLHIAFPSHATQMTEAIEKSFCHNISDACTALLEMMCYIGATNHEPTDA